MSLPGLSRVTTILTTVSREPSVADELSSSSVACFAPMLCWLGPANSLSRDYQATILAKYKHLSPPKRRLKLAHPKSLKVIDAKRSPASGA